jgi:hypothetical protein
MGRKQEGMLGMFAGTIVSPDLTLLASKHPRSLEELNLWLPRIVLCGRVMMNATEL